MAVRRRMGAMVCLLGCLWVSEVRGEVLRWLLVGDTGENCTYVKKSKPKEVWQEQTKDSPQTKVARHMADVVLKEQIRDIFFLGDNFYPEGLKDGPLGEACLELAFTIPYGGLLPVENLHVLPGNHDHYSDDSVARQNALSGKQWTYYTRPALIHLVPGLVDVVLFDSMPMIESRKYRRRFQTELTVQLQQAKAPWLILMAHHPLHTIGEHSYRTWIGMFNKNDWVSIEYRAFAAAVKKAIIGSGRPVQLFVAGHDHSLQFLEEDERDELLPKYHVISGAGSKTSMVHSLGKKAWGDAVLGFAVLELDTDKPEKMVVRFFGSDKQEEIKSFDIELGEEQQKTLGLGRAEPQDSSGSSAAAQ